MVGAVGASKSLGTCEAEKFGERESPRPISTRFELPIHAAREEINEVRIEQAFRDGVRNECGNRYIGEVGLRLRSSAAGCRSGTVPPILRSAGHGSLRSSCGC